MADLAQLEAALVKADAAGDAAGARILAGEVRKMRAAQPSQADVRKVENAMPPYRREPTTKERILENVVRMAPGMGAMSIPFAMTQEGIRQGGELLDRAAYGAGGAVTDAAAKVLPPEAAAGAGFAANVATQAIPSVLGGEAAKVASPAFRAGAEGLMQSALKPSLKSLRDGNAAKAIQTMLDEGINVTKGGVEKLRGMIGNLNREITEAIAASPATVHKGKVASELYGTVKKFEKQVSPSADLKAIEGAWSDFLNHPLLKGDEIPVKLAQELKQGTYTVLKGKYGEQGSAATEAQKALARGLKEEIAKAVPEVAKLNAKESELINALYLAEKRALLDGNKNMGGLAWLSHSPTTWAAFMVDKSALFKSAMARMMNANQRTIPGALGSGAVGTYEAATQNQR